MLCEFTIGHRVGFNVANKTSTFYVDLHAIKPIALLGPNLLFFFPTPANNGERKTDSGAYVRVSTPANSSSAPSSPATKLEAAPVDTDWANDL